MLEVVNQRRPLLGIDVIVANYELVRDVHPQNLDLGGNSSSKLIQPLTAQPVQVNDTALQMYRAFPNPLRLHDFARQGVNPEMPNLSGSKWNWRVFRSGTGFFPVSGASFSTFCHISGDGILMTHSGARARFSAVFVSSRSPSMKVQPSAQKEEMGARFVPPSSFGELIRATGVPK